MAKLPKPAVVAATAAPAPVAAPYVSAFQPAVAEPRQSFFSLKNIPLWVFLFLAAVLVVQAMAKHAG